MDEDMKALGISDHPLMTVEISEAAIGLEGWVCVHALGKDGSSGGIRCVGDVTKEEVQALARAMTYKYSFFGIPQGGAKAGLRIDYDEDPKRKAELIRAAARHLEPLVRRSTIWSPWTDMNFYGEDLKMFYAEMGRSFTPNPHHNSSHRTAISAFWSLDASTEFHRMDPRKTRLTLEGFGSVASYLAPYLMQKGFQVIGVSTHRGAVKNLRGLDLMEIVGMRERHGSAWIDQKGNWERLERDELFDLETDILIPCARVHSIGPEKARRIKAKLVLPIANVPCTDEALAILDAQGIDYIPDFVVNGGGVSGHIQNINDPFGELFKPMLHRMFTAARASCTSIRKMAEDAAHLNYDRIASDAYTSESMRRKLLKRMGDKGMLPKKLLTNYQRDQLDRVYANMEFLFPASAQS